MKRMGSGYRRREGYIGWVQGRKKRMGSGYRRREG